MMLSFLTSNFTCKKIENIPITNSPEKSKLINPFNYIYSNKGSSLPP
jgi:hypothetical protein